MTERIRAKHIEPEEVLGMIEEMLQEYRDDCLMDIQDEGATPHNLAWLALNVTIWGIPERLQPFVKGFTVGFGEYSYQFQYVPEGPAGYAMKLAVMQPERAIELLAPGEEEVTDV